MKINTQLKHDDNQKIILTHPVSLGHFSSRNSFIKEVQFRNKTGSISEHFINKHNLNQPTSPLSYNPIAGYNDANIVNLFGSGSSSLGLE
jgi:hypothetical protein